MMDINNIVSEHIVVQCGNAYESNATPCDPLYLDQSY